MRVSKYIYCLAGLISLAAGCSKPDIPLGEVTGRVTLDGQPVQNAEVEFTPVSGNRVPSLGETDADGRYIMRFSTTRDGVMLGTNRVRVRSGQPIIVGGKDLGAREVVPARYHSKTDLERKVVEGENVFDFELTTEK
jgi:hypothetical protein